MNWKVTYWDGGNLREVVFYSDPYNVWNAVMSTSASQCAHSILKVERIAS